MLSMHENEQFLFEALRAGASGYVLKTAADRDLVNACRATMRGETFLYAGAVAALVREHLDRDATSLDPLTPRELEVVKLVAEGHTSDEIAGMLFISRKTVDRHRANILEKLGMRDRVDLTRYAIRRGTDHAVDRDAHPLPGRRRATRLMGDATDRRLRARRRRPSRLARGPRAAPRPGGRLPAARRGVERGGARDRAASVTGPTWSSWTTP